MKVAAIDCLWNEQKGYMKNKILMLLAAVAFALCSFSAWAAGSSCNPNPPQPPEPDPNECMSIELGE